MLALAEWSFSEGATQHERLRIQSWFGKLTLRYTADRVYSDYDGDRTVCPYRIIGADSGSVAILRRTDGENEISHIHLQIEQMGTYRLRPGPDWFLEGMAYALSEDPWTTIGEPWDGYRAKYQEWAAGVSAAEFWVRARELR